MDLRLDTHIADISNLFKWEEIKMPAWCRIPMAAGRRPARWSTSSWTTYLVENSHHDVMIDQPEWLADILMKHS
jgi:hypothetical protein